MFVFLRVFERKLFATLICWLHRLFVSITSFLISMFLSAHTDSYNIISYRHYQSLICDKSPSIQIQNECYLHMTFMHSHDISYVSKKLFKVVLFLFSFQYFKIFLSRSFNSTNLYLFA